MKIKTKQEIRQELEDEIRHFLAKGGAINDIEQGASGKVLGANLNACISFNGEKKTHTLLTDEVKALEERKQHKPAGKTQTAKAAPKKKIIYDDFGEPLREIWE